MKKLYNFIFSYIQKRRPRQAHSFPNWNKVISVLILFESDITEKNLNIKQLVKELQQEGKEVTAWGYVDNKTAISGILRDYRVLAQKDTNLLGQPKEMHLKDFERLHFDVVIDLSLHDCLPLRYLMLYADADFKAGRQTAEPYMADFMVVNNDNEDPAFLFDQILHYLHNIESKD